jgi:hypothetical protein
MSAESYTPLYIVDSSNIYKKINVQDYNLPNDDTHIYEYFTKNTLYGVANTLLYFDSNYVEKYNVLLTRLAHIIWPEAILVDAKDFEKINYIKITIGGQQNEIWNINADLLRQISDSGHKISDSEHEIYQSKMKIKLPRNLFMNKYNFCNNNLPELDDFIGFPMCALQYHELRIEIILHSPDNFEFYLLEKLVYLNENLKRIMYSNNNLFGINKISKNEYLDTYINPVKITPRILSDAINNNDLFICIKNLIRKRNLIPNLLSWTPLNNDMNKIISEYDKIDIDMNVAIKNNEILQFTLDGQNIYSICLSKIDIYDGINHSQT